MKVHNEEIKQRFLNEYPEKTAGNYRRIFEKSANYEERLGKDLYNFNITQIDNVLTSLNPYTANSSRVNGRMLVSYIDWAIEEDLRTQEVNPLTLQVNATGQEYYNQFVDQEKNMYFSDVDLRYIEDGCINPMDAAMIRLLFEGVGGQDLIELRNLTKHDIIDGHKLKLLKSENPKKHREIELYDPDRTIELINEAFDADEYIKRNGVLPDTHRTSNSRGLVDNDFVVRPTNVNVTDEMEPVNKSVIFSRLRVLSQTFPDVAPTGVEVEAMGYLRPTNITKSGMIYFAKQLIDEYGTLGKEQYFMIAERYNISMYKKHPDQFYYNYRQWLNEELVQRIYNNQPE